MSTLVLIPGLACDARMWREVLPGLQGGLPAGGCTVSQVHSQFASIETMAAGLLDRHPGPLVLCGASMGGIIAMEAARQAPERIAGLALLGTNARPETEDMRRLRSGAIAFFEAGRALEVLQLNLPMAFHPVHAGHAGLTQTYLDMVMAAGSAQLVAQNRAIMARPDARLHLPQRRCPTLVLCGESDQLTPPECSREIAALVPHAQFHLVEKAGHMLTLEQPEAVAGFLLEFLKKLA
ncbi:MAG: hypothetical protein RLZZ126_612 [Pseudomonadota bacterium]|jgi:pimeloyl-ACP methyl ester carboxylesterase